MSELGLRRDMVLVAEHQPGWARAADAAIAEISSAAGELLLGVEHVGSTSVPGLAAKPILDIALGVAGSSTPPELTRRLIALGYLDRGDYGADGGHIFVRETAPDVRSIHLHIVEYRGTQWRNYRHVRDSLRADPALRDAYAKLKRELAGRFVDNRPGYTAAKAAFIQSILARPSPARSPEAPQ